MSNEEMRETMRIFKFLEDSSLLRKGLTQKIENVTKEQTLIKNEETLNGKLHFSCSERGAFRRMLLAVLVPSLLGNNLAGNGVIKTGDWVHDAWENY